MGGSTIHLRMRDAGLMEFGGGWVIDLDIEDFFGSVDWGHLRSFLDRRVRDGVIRRAIGKWLNAGVMEAGKLSHPERGTPQGGVVSPLLSERSDNSGYGNLMIMGT